jgi:hypothetical protein
MLCANVIAAQTSGFLVCEFNDSAGLAGEALVHARLRIALKLPRRR